MDKVIAWIHPSLEQENDGHPNWFFNKISEVGIYESKNMYLISCFNSMYAVNELL